MIPLVMVHTLLAPSTRHTNIVVKTIENMLSVDGMDDLLVDKDLFTYINAEDQDERHGATMLYSVSHLRESGSNDRSWNGCAPQEIREVQDGGS